MELIHADCLPELIKLPDNHVDLVLTDPPYGLNIARTGKVGKGCTFTPKM
jgi:site-specific DNA-methyltransferase (adenine-specific)